jgi:hypothetical protein
MDCSLQRTVCHLSGGDRPLSEEDFDLYAAAVRAFKLVHRKVSARSMWLDQSELDWLAAPRAGVIHEKVKRHGGVRCELRGGNARTPMELFAGKNLRNAFLLANPLGCMNSRQEGKLAYGL